SVTVVTPGSLPRLPKPAQPETASDRVNAPATTAGAVRFVMGAISSLRSGRPVPAPLSARNLRTSADRTLLHLCMPGPEAFRPGIANILPESDRYVPDPVVNRCSPVRSAACSEARRRVGRRTTRRATERPGTPVAGPV